MWIILSFGSNIHEMSQPLATNSFQAFHCYLHNNCYRNFYLYLYFLHSFKTKCIYWCSSYTVEDPNYNYFKSWRWFFKSILKFCKIDIINFSGTGEVSSDSWKKTSVPKLYWWHMIKLVQFHNDFIHNTLSPSIA